jgi:drug/metabolite transporter (DMT)-like permease
MSFIAITSAIGFGALHFVALQYTTAINGALFQGLMAMLILVVAWIVLGDRIGPREGLGVLLGFAGLSAIVMRGDPAVLLGLSFNRGDIILLIATTSYAIYAVMLRRAPSGLSTSALMTVMFGFATVYMLPLWLAEVYAFDRPLPVNFTSAWSIAYMTIFPSVLAQIFWATGVAKVGPGRAGYFIYLSPVFGVLLAMALLGEVFRWYHAVGIVLIFTGLWLATVRKTAKKQ